MIRRRSYMRRTPFRTTPPRPDSLRAVVADLDAEVRRIVKKRDKVCVTCGDSAPCLLEVSHFISRRYLNTRFDLSNCNLQCRNCHKKFHLGQSRKYHTYMIARYGREVLGKLYETRLSMAKPSAAELRTLLTFYRSVR